MPLWGRPREADHARIGSEVEGRLDAEQACRRHHVEVPSQTNAPPRCARPVDEVRVEQQARRREEFCRCPVDGGMLLGTADIVQRLRRDHRLRDAFDRVRPGVVAEIGPVQGSAATERTRRCSAMSSIGAEKSSPS